MTVHAGNAVGVRSSTSTAEIVVWAVASAAFQLGLAYALAHICTRAEEIET
jgi:hypothetical protein